ncbi:MAG: DUF255 domain-containing protein [Rhodobacteraceae bacterium]|nr:DUF255 domain-containing protein [Paracoccaceae bacterium]
MRRRPIAAALISATLLALTPAHSLAELAPPRSPELTAELQAALVAKGAGHEPRTRHFTKDGAPKYVNRLIRETSPYLIQHAHNPVDWRPWGPETLAAAQAEGKPIFLSVGYATCHWCHVMEEESFDDEETAGLLNRDFIAVKVDREQRPDIDQTYMLATLFLTQRGGWPNSVWLTPEGEPFYAGTYYPKDMFQNVLTAVSQAWEQQRDEVKRTAGQLSTAIRDYSTERAAAETIDGAVRVLALRALAESHNDLEGGFGIGPQFPQETHLLFLLDHWRRTGSEEALEIVRLTLDAIAAGGIHDHVGGGFHRYAVDPNWRTPHFEKMLYNQALLSQSFVEAWQATGEERYARAARRAFDYVLRDMIAPDGAFYAAEDADSLGLPNTPFAGERAEGAFYTWSTEQATAVLGDASPPVIDSLGLTEPPTLETGPVAHLPLEAEVDFATLDPLLERMRAARENRPRPLRDEKIIAGWNGLMIRSLVIGGTALDEPRYLDAAKRAGKAIWARLWREGDGLQRLYTAEKVADLPGKLDDYAWMGLAALALADAQPDSPWADRADGLAVEIAARFDDGVGRLKMAEADGPLGPSYEQDDGATPAAESSALELFAKLSHRREGLENEERALRLLAELSGRMAERPIERTTAQRAAAILQEGESGLARPASRGKVWVAATREGQLLRISLQLAEGWHLNAHETLQEELIPIELMGDSIEDVAYPEPVTRTLGFQDEPLALIEGDAELVAVLKDEAATAVRLTVQACSDAVCLAPEDHWFRFP